MSLYEGRTLMSQSNTIGILAAGVLALLLAILTACGSENGVDDLAEASSATSASNGSPTSATLAPKERPTPAAQSPSSSPIADTLAIVTTSNIVADWVRAIGGGRVEVVPLLPAGADPHTFQPGAKDIAHVADADLVLTIGLGLEAAWLSDLVENAARDPARIVSLGAVVEPTQFVEIHGDHDQHDEDGEHDERDEDGEHGEDEEHDEHDAHAHGALDPHFWFDPLKVQRAVSDIAARLAVLDPESGPFYRGNASEYNSELDALHAWVREQVAQVPPGDRLLVTSHDSFGYFASAYGFKVVGVVFPGGTTEREASAEELAELIDDVRDTGAKAVFTETIHSDKLSQRVAEETGAEVVGPLYTGSLSFAEGDGDTYLDMMRYNVATIVEALK